MTHVEPQQTAAFGCNHVNKFGRIQSGRRFDLL
jgi:hypothetical protein